MLNLNSSAFGSGGSPSVSRSGTRDHSVGSTGRSISAAGRRSGEHIIQEEDEEDEDEVEEVDNFSPVAGEGVDETIWEGGN